MEQRNREAKIGKNTTYLSDDNIIHTIIVGEVDVDIANAIRECHLEFLSMVEGKVKSFIDINKAGKQSPKSRDIGREMFENERYDKIALFGMHPVARVIASFVMGVTQKKDMRFFKTRDEAFDWLRE